MRQNQWTHSGVGMEAEEVAAALDERRDSLAAHGRGSDAEDLGDVDSEAAEDFGAESQGAETQGAESRGGDAAPRNSQTGRYGQNQPRSVIGTRVPRKDAKAKVTGQAKYACDVVLPGMLFAVGVRCPHASASVLTVDATSAASLPGVRGVLTFVGKRIRFAGDEVAVVAADTLQQARDAARAIKVTYDVYPFAVTIEDAMATGAPQVFETKANVGTPRVSEAGDITKGFTEAAATVSHQYRTQIQTHSPMETHGAVVRWTDDTHIEAWVSTQGTFSAQSDLASYFSLPTANVRVYCDFIGGGFGSKIGAGSYSTNAAELSRMTGKPVRYVYDRRDEQLCAGNRPDSIQQLKVGARADGTLCAVQLSGYGTGGTGGGAGFGAPARSLYTCANYRTEETQVYTNCGPAASMRAPGHPQGVFPFESAIDELSYALKIDPVQFRILNDGYALRREQFTKGAERFGWSSRNPLPNAGTGYLKRGTGVASCTWNNGGQPGCEVWVTVYQDGRVLVQNGAQDLGTGTKTWMAMLVAEEMGLTIDRVEIQMGDTTLPYGPLSGGSTTTPTLAPPTKQAGTRARDAVAAVVAPVLGAAASDLVFANNTITAPNGKSISFTAGCAYLTGPTKVTGTRTDQMKFQQDLVTGVHFVEVEVDIRTGVIRVLRALAVHNAGRILNLLTAESQVYGGVIQGMNYALYEERIMERNLGIMMNANLEGYKIGGSKDMPAIDVWVMDVGSGGTSVGAVGLGESPIIPTAAAIGNAVYHATGARLLEIPMTPARVLKALGTLASTRGSANQSARASDGGDARPALSTLFPNLMNSSLTEGGKR